MDISLKQRLVWVAVCAVLSVSSLSSAQTMRQPEPASIDFRPVDRRQPQLRGIVAPGRSVVIATPFDTTVAGIPIEEGQAVIEGVTLAYLDDGAQQVIVDIARLEAEAIGQVRRAHATLEAAELHLERARAVYANHAASDWEVRQARVQRDIAMAELQIAIEDAVAAGETLRLEEERLRRFFITAPFRGTVSRRLVEPGSALARGEPIMVFVDNSWLRAELLLPSSFFGNLTLNRTYTLFADEPVNREVRGTLIHQDPVIDSASGTLRVVFRIENPGHEMPAGFPVRLVWPQPDPLAMSENVSLGESAPTAAPTGNR